MKAHSFTKRPGRPKADKPEFPMLVRMQQFRSMGAKPHLDPVSGKLTASMPVYNPRSMSWSVQPVTQPELSSYPCGIMFAKGLLTKSELVAAGMHVWAHIQMLGRRGTMVKSLSALDVANQIAEGDCEPLSRLAALGMVSQHDPVAAEAICRAYRAANSLLLRRGFEVHGAINELVIYEGYQGWWLEQDHPEKTKPYKWIKSGMGMLEKHWPDEIERMIGVFCP